jgi:hypothetical protein
MMIRKIDANLINLPMATTTLLQFADDTAIIMAAHAMNTKVIIATLEVFAQVSGLQINLSKSAFLPIAISQHQVPTIASLLNCQPLSSPILPLTIKKPNKPAYLSLISSVQRRLEGFKGRLTHPDAILHALDPDRSGRFAIMAMGTSLHGTILI